MIDELAATVGLHIGAHQVANLRKRTRKAHHMHGLSTDVREAQRGGCAEHRLLFGWSPWPVKILEVKAGGGGEIAGFKIRLASDGWRWRSALPRRSEGMRGRVC